MVAFIFGGDTTETPETIKRKREIARALMAAQGAPRNVGEGLNALGDGIVAAVLDRRAANAEKTGMESANKAFAPLMDMFSGGGQTASAPSAGIPNSEAAAEVNATSPNPYRDAIASIESAGSGDYSAVGPTHPKMGRALGRYQVMEANIGPWSKEALGREVTAEEFMQNPKLQDAIFDHKFNGYVQQYGPEGAAQAWFGGPGGVGKVDRKDSLGTSIGAYGDKFTSALGGNTQVAQAMTAPTQQPQQMDMRAVMQALSNPFLAPGQRAVAEALVQREQARQQAILEQQLQQQDPKYQLDLQKGQTELDLLRNPRMTPAEEARIGLDREKFDFERNKPRDPLKVNQGETVISPDGKMIFKADPKPEPKPSAVQEYEYAKEQGFPGTFQDWEASKKGGMSLQVDPATGAVTFQQGGNIKPMTEGQSKDAVFATRAEGALGLINEYGDALTGTEGVIGGTVGQIPVVGNYAKTEAFQQAEQAGKEFLQAILRKDTGAAIAKEETAEYGSVYLPRPGDSPQLLQQKKASRLRALEAIKAGMPPQAILAQEKALANTNKAVSADKAPDGVDAELWKHMTPEEKSLWQN